MSARTISSAISWTLTSRLLIQVCQFGITVVTARLLSPEEFGAIGMVLVFSGFAHVLSDMGVAAALIHKREVNHADLSTAFWTQIALGSAIAIAFYGSAGYLADFYGVPPLEPLTKILSVAFVAQSLGQIQASILQRAYRFAALSIANLLAIAASGCVCVGLALYDYGVYALAWQQVAAAAVFAAVVWTVSLWRPSFRFSRVSFRFIARYSGFLSGHTLINYWFRNGDNLLIGKVLGASELGLYGRAYALMFLPLNTIGAVVGQVLFPVLSRLQDDPERYRRTYNYTLQAIALVMFPLMGGMFVLASPIIEIVFGPQWLAAAPALRILSLVGLMQSVIFPVGWVFTSLGKTHRQFQITLLLSPFFVVAMTIGIQFGIVGVAYAYACWSMASAAINFLVVSRILNNRMPDVLIFLLPPLIRTLVMIVALSLVSGKFELEMGKHIGLLINILIGFIIYFISCEIYKDEAYSDVRTHILGRLR